jgi:hypothetical protein
MCAILPRPFIMTTRVVEEWRLLSIILLLAWHHPSHHKFILTSNAWTYTSRRATPMKTTLTSLQSSSSNSNNNDIEFYKSQAEQLRNEIEQFEQQKRRDNELYQQQQNDILQQQKQVQDRYSAMVPILKPDGTTIMERCTFTPIYTDGTSYITTVESELPLGILIGEVTTNDTPNDNENNTFNNNASTTLPRRAPYIVIDEIAPNSNGEICGLLMGDIIHACTACKVDMELPTWQLLLGGIGRPKTNRYMHSVGHGVVGDGAPSTSTILENTMNAIASNRIDPEQRPILLVIERREE